jgi:Ca2+/H+ antiporter, TMEM165/GDT1 family
VLFLVFAVFMWRRKHDDGEHGRPGASATRPTFWRATAAAFGVVFVAEWGDLTQLGTAALAARYAQPVAVFSWRWASTCASCPAVLLAAGLVVGGGGWA